MNLSPIPSHLALNYVHRCGQHFAFDAKWARGASAKSIRVVSAANARAKLLSRDESKLARPLVLEKRSVPGGRSRARFGQVGWQIGAPERIRTSDLPLRRRSLYPTELPGHGSDCQAILPKRRDRLELAGCAIGCFQ